MSIFWLRLNLFFILNFIFGCCFSQIIVPAIYSNITSIKNNLYFEYKGKKHKSPKNKMLEHKFFGDPSITLKNLKSLPYGTKTGLKFDFNNTDLNGTLYYGFINYDIIKFPNVVFVDNKSEIKKGKTEINIIDNLSSNYDIIDWKKNAKGTIGYRVVNAAGNILYDGRVAFKGTGPFTVEKTIIEGPFINKLTHNEVTISFETNLNVLCSINIEGKIFSDEKPDLHHEINITGLNPKTEYNYKVIYGDNYQSYSFITNPKSGTRNSFVFGYASDSRKGGGGGERDLFGVNYYVTKKIITAASMLNVAFMQFTGDIVNGYLTDKGKIDLQYSNCKHSLEPFASYFPVYTGIGNHELLFYPFLILKDLSNPIMIDRFPFETESMEAVFASNFVNPVNGPESEDGAYYDPDLAKIDFPPYKETVYSYTYDNAAMIVLNSDYWYAVQLAAYPETSGNLHGYIMDRQLDWLHQTINNYENDANIDHIFITIHTPFFPNGGHSHDAMWYSGNNKPRAYVAGKPVKKGIIERRDELLDILVNKSSKTVAILCGDEHNYSRLNITEDMPKYPDSYVPEKIKLKRNIWQITNGAAGAPYYAQEKLPWSNHVAYFTPQYALCFFYVEGSKVRIEVINPETMELLDEAILKE